MVEDRKVVGDLLWIVIGSDRERGRELEGAMRKKEIEEERHFAAWCKEKVRERRREREKSERRRKEGRERV